MDRHWTVPLPAECRTPSAMFRVLDTLRLMHTVDGQSWETIGQIVAFAAKVWQPDGMIGSPAALRTKTRKGDRRVWEAIKAQMKANGTPAESYVFDDRWKEQLKDKEPDANAANAA